VHDSSRPCLEFVLNRFFAGTGSRMEAGGAGDACESAVTGGDDPQCGLPGHAAASRHPAALHGLGPVLQGCGNALGRDFPCPPPPPLKFLMHLLNPLKDLTHSPSKNHPAASHGLGPSLQGNVFSMGVSQIVPDFEKCPFDRLASAGLFLEGLWRDLGSAWDRLLCRSRFFCHVKVGPFLSGNRHAP